MRALLIIAGLLLSAALQAKPALQLNEQNYFATQGLNVTVFADIYPDGHQTGVTVIQHGSRVAANGDLRLEVSPGQWSPVPRGIGEAVVDRKAQRISQTLAYPDPAKDRKGFNPILYPDLEFTYQVHVTALDGNSFRISVDLEKPLPKAWIGRVGFNFELFPGHLFGKSFLMDDQTGIFPQQPNGPLVDHHGDVLTAPLAVGKRFTVAPDHDHQRMRVEVKRGGPLELWDGRANHNNGWYILRSEVPEGATKNAIEWIVTPNVVKNWRYSPVIQVSQLGYGAHQAKKIVIEQDALDTKADRVTLSRLTEDGKKLVRQGKPEVWGRFLRYHYLTYDFSDVTEPGMYVVS